MTCLKSISLSPRHFVGKCDSFWNPDLLGVEHPCLDAHLSDDLFNEHGRQRRCWCCRWVPEKALDLVQSVLGWAGRSVEVGDFEFLSGGR